MPNGYEYTNTDIPFGITQSNWAKRLLDRHYTKRTGSRIGIKPRASSPIEKPADHWLADGNENPAEGFVKWILWRSCNVQPQQKAISESSADSPKQYEK